MSGPRNVIVGGGAAGFFAAITCAEAAPDAQVIILERGSRVLDKVRISGGGRCNVTNACFDPKDFITRYPRGGRALLGPFMTFSARETVDWFAARGVALLTEPDGRMFPVSNTSQTIMDCLENGARKAGVEVRPNSAVERLEKRAEGGFTVVLAGDRLDSTASMTAAGQKHDSPYRIHCDRVLLATGGCRTAAGGQLAVGLGHTLEPPVPSLFTFQINVPWLRELAGVALPDAEVSIPAAKQRERGPLLVTHWGLSGPAVLRSSAWGARALAALDYRFEIVVNWLPASNPEQLHAQFQERRQTQPAKMVVNWPVAPLSARLWEQLVKAAGVPMEARWASLTRGQAHALVQMLTHAPFHVEGKSTNKEEFVTCGGVRLKEVDFKTMESRICPGLHFAGELLDIDGITGGFNFQAAWTTGYLAGRAMAAGRASAR